MYPIQDQKARELGATLYYDEIIQQVRNGRKEGYHFSRHYFTSDRLEVAYFIPDLLPYNGADYLHVLPEKRIWVPIPALISL